MNKAIFLFIIPIIIFGCYVFKGDNSNKLNNNFNENISDIIKNSDTLNINRKLFTKDIFLEKHGSFISSSGNGLLRLSIEELRKKSIKLTNNSLTRNNSSKTINNGEIYFSFMTNNPKLINSLEPGYKGPFTNNVLYVGDSYILSYNNLSGYLDEWDEKLFIVLDSFSSYNIGWEIINNKDN